MLEHPEYSPSPPGCSYVKVKHCYHKELDAYKLAGDFFEETVNLIEYEVI